MNYDRVFLLSGLDYPLWPNSKILNFLSAHPKLEFIKARNISHTKMINEKCTTYHFFRDIRCSYEIRRWLMFSARIVMKILPIRKLPHIYTNGKINEVFYASEWFCLTGDCVRYAYDELENNKSWEKYFKYAFCPDELVLATIICNSPFYNNIIKWNEADGYGLTGVTYTHYIEYDSHIHIYDENDFNKLIASDKMFVRKLTTQQSLNLIRKIDQYRNLPVADHQAQLENKHCHT